MKRLMAGALAVAALTLSACGDQQQPPEVVTPSPMGTSSFAPSPTGVATPSQEELSAMAERSYRAAFVEWKRLERAGGASSPTAQLSDNAGGDYLNNVMTALRIQEEKNIRVNGPMPTTRVAPSPGEGRKGSDPAMTLRVCEDNTASSATQDGQETTGSLVEGSVYIGLTDGRYKVISSLTKEVPKCVL